jgi:lipoprotein-releasing system permease protein
MPHLPFFISTRYLFAKKSHNAINIITGISVAVLTLGTTALILILSVFNGLEDLIADLYNSAKPDIEISAKEGKYFSLDSLAYQAENDLSLACWSPVIEDMAMAKYNSGTGDDRQTIVKLKAVNPDYVCMSGIDTLVFDGSFQVEYRDAFFAVLGYGVAGRLDLRLNNPTEPVYFYYPRAIASPSDMMNAFMIEGAIPSGVIYMQQEEDDIRVYVSLNFARRLMGLNAQQATSLELQVKEGIDIQKFRNRLQEKLGEGFEVKSRMEMNATLYNITRSEKWTGFLILAFIILLAAFNLVGSLTVLIVEKKADIQTFLHMGSTPQLIRRIFFFEGILITIAGGLIGMLLGFLLVIAQLQFGIIPMEGGFAIEAFPVALRWMDFVWVFLLIIFLGILSTWIPVSRMKKHLFNTIEKVNK